jgi:hypothetical protein
METSSPVTEATSETKEANGNTREVEQSPATLEKAQLKGMLAEARATREMLLDFDTAIKNGTFQGHQMLAVAKGVAFLHAIVAQNKSHIDNLQERVK